MEFRILGSLEAVDDTGRITDLGPPKARAVLAVLLVNVNRVVSLDQLIDQLWGEEPPATATGTLQAYVSRLRLVLEPDRKPRQPPQSLVTRAPGYVLQVRPEAFDVARFEAAAASGRRLVGEGRAGAALEAIDRALGEWRGPAYAEFAMEEFAHAEAIRLEELRLGATEDRMEAQLTLGRHRDVVATAEALLAAQPLRERLWGLLMVSLYRSGRQAEALRAYQSARDHLGQELGIEPGPDLRRLEADILAQAPDLRWSPATEGDAAPNPSDTVGVLETSDGSADKPAPLLGRDQALAQLQHAFARAKAGRSGVALIAGEAGIGKTRLVSELAAHVRERGARVVWGGGYEGEGAPVFWPWVEVLQALFDAHSELPTVLQAQAAELAQLVPEITERIGALPPPPSLDSRAARFRLYQAVSAVLVASARQQALLLVLDDLHWADAPSLQLLTFVVRGLQDAPILVVGTYRPMEVGPTHPLAETLAALARQRLTDRVVLSGLYESDVARFVALTTGTEPTVDFARALTRRTAGNPFFLGELVHLLEAEAALHNAGLEAVLARALPAGVADVIRRRLARLPEQTNALLSLAAVAGTEFEMTELEAAAELDPDAALDALEPAIAMGVVTEEAGSVARYRFTHALVQDAIYNQIVGLRRSRLHARIGAVIEGRHPEEAVAALAHHYHQATPVLGPEKAVTFAMAAADAAMAKLGYEEAERHLRRALVLVQDSPQRRRWAGREVELHLRLALLLAMTRGDGAPEVRQASDAALVLAGESGDPKELLALAVLSSFHCVRADYSAAQEMASKLLAAGASTGSPALLLAGHYETGVVAFKGGRFDAARHHLEGAIAVSNSFADLPTVLPENLAVAARSWAAVVVWLLGEEGPALDLNAQALELAASLSHPFSQALAGCFDIWLDVFRRDLQPVAEKADALVALAQDNGFPLYAGIGLLLGGWARAIRGATDNGVQDVVRGLSAYDATGARMMRPFFLGLLGEAQGASGRPEDALSSLDDALAEANERDEQFYAPELHRLRAELLRNEWPERIDEADASLVRAIELATSQGSVRFQGRAEASRTPMPERRVLTGRPGSTPER